jgi:membrane-associated protease RseP (regulator of RpoE activity)
MMSAVAWAGWAGLLVTAMNLLPVGQLDGGHVMYVLIGRERAEKLYSIVLMFLIGLGFVWSGWWFWAVLLFLIGRRYAEPLDQITPLDEKRKRLALLALVVFVLTFTPVPLTLF